MGKYRVTVVYIEDNPVKQSVIKKAFASCNTDARDIEVFVDVNNKDKYPVLSRVLDRRNKLLLLIMKLSQINTYYGERIRKETDPVKASELSNAWDTHADKLLDEGERLGVDLERYTSVKKLLKYLFDE